MCHWVGFSTFTFCNHHLYLPCSKIFSLAQRKPLELSSRPHAPVLSPHSHSSALSLWLHLSGAFHIKTIMQCVWLLSLSILFSRFIDFIACVSSSFLYTAEYYSTVCIYYILLSIQNVSE